MDCIVPRNGSWCGRHSQGTCELRTPWVTTWGNSSQHQGGGINLKLRNVKTPWWFRSRPRPRFLRGNVFRQSPKRIFENGETKFVKHQIPYIYDWTKCLIECSERLWIVCECMIGFKIVFLINLFRAHYIPPTCTHRILSPHWVFLYSTLLYLLFLQD